MITDYKKDSTRLIEELPTLPVGALVYYYGALHTVIDTKSEQGKRLAAVKVESGQPCPRP